MANTTDKSILTAAGKALLAQLNAEEKPLIIDKMIFANVPNRPEFPQPDDVVPTDHVVHQEGVEQRGRLSADSVIYSTTLTSDVGPFEFNWTGAYCSEYGVLVTIDHHALTPKSADEPGVAGNTLVRSVVLEYKDIAEITNITVDASSWQYNATPRMKKMDDDVAQAIIDQNGKDWFIEDGFLVTPQASAFNIKAGAGYVSGNRVTLEFDRNVQVPNKPSFIYVDAHREGTPTGEQVTLFDFVVTAEEKDDYTDANGVKHFVCKIAQVLADGSVSDLRSEGESASREWVSGENQKNSEADTDTKQLIGSIETLINKNISGRNAVYVTNINKKLVIYNAPSDGVIESVNVLPPYSITISGKQYYLLDVAHYNVFKFNIKAFGASGNGDEGHVIRGAFDAIHGSGIALDLNGLGISFSDDLVITGWPEEIKGVVNGGLYSLNDSRVIVGQISKGEFTDLFIENDFEDQGTRDSTYTRVIVRGHSYITASLRDVLWNKYVNCEFGFGNKPNGSSFKVAVASGNPFNANTFNVCKFRGNRDVNLTCFDTVDAQHGVRGNTFFSCDMSAIHGDATIMKHGPNFSGNCFIGGYYEGGGKIDFRGAGDGNRFIGARADDSHILGKENLAQLELSSSGRYLFAHHNQNGVNIALNSYVRVIDGIVPGWSNSGQRTQLTNAIDAPAGFSGDSALKMEQVGLSGTSGLVTSVPPKRHKGSGVSIAVRVYVPSSHKGSPYLTVGNLAGVDGGCNIIERDEWAIVSTFVEVKDASRDVSVRIYNNYNGEHSNDNVMYVDWVVISNGSTCSLFQESVTDHHCQDLYQYGDILMGVDNTYSIGSPSNRAKEIFATNDTINISDERLKTSIENISDVERLVARELKANLGKYKFLTAIDTKGSEARYHFGVGAQTVKSIFEKHGLVPNDYALFCYDRWGEEKDEDGNVIKSAGDRYGVRYAELFIFILMALS